MIPPWDSRNFHLEPECHGVRVVFPGDEVEFRERFVPHDGIRSVIVR